MKLTNMQDFDFIFFLQIMANVLGLSNELSRALQRKDKDIVIAIKLVKETKSLLSKMKHDSMIVDMSNPFIDPRRKRHKDEILTNLHHYPTSMFK